MKSRISLFGLPHEVDVVRFQDLDDGAGGVTANGSKTIVYPSWPCRITTLSSEDKVVMDFLGPDTGNTFKVIGEPVKNILKNHFLEVPFGVLPNVNGVDELGEGFPLSFYAGDILLTWDYENEQYSNDVEEPTHILKWEDAWIYTGPDLSNVWVIDNDCSPFDIWDQWDDGPELRYSVELYRVVWVKMQIDEFGAFHHVSLYIELEDSHND